MKTRTTFPGRLLAASAALGLAVAFSAASRADDSELARIRAEIEAQGLDWTAGETSVSQLPDDVFQAMLMPLDAGQRAEQMAAVFGSEPSPAFQAAELPSWVPRPAPEDPVFTWRDVDGEDWTTPVQNQGMCGACTIFAAVAAIEGAANVSYGSPDLDLDLSEQNLLSCTSVSCSGGGMDAAQGLNQAEDYGVPDEGCHPYTATDGNCDDACADFDNRAIMVSDWGWVAGGIFLHPSDEQIKQALSNGPLTTSMTVYSDFEAYEEGVYVKTASAQNLGGHAVILIGWNDEHNSWYGKNSWGPAWGDAGYFEIQRGQAGFADNMTAWTTVDTSQVPGMMSIDSDDILINLEFGSGDTYTRTVDVTYVGETGEMDVSVDLQGMPDWLSVTPTTGTIGPEQPLQLSLLFDEAGWPLSSPGIQVHHVSVVAGHGVARSVKTTLRAVEPPSSDADTDSDSDSDSDGDADTDTEGTGAEGDGDDAGCGCNGAGAPRTGLLARLLGALLP